MTTHLCLLSDIDDCADQPCQNGGNCTDAVNDYTCVCVAGYSGKNCSTGKKMCLFAVSRRTTKENALIPRFILITGRERRGMFEIIILQ